jgi:hypothetical protein
MGLVLVWGTIATLAMTVILEGARRLHVSRMSLPFIFGAFLTGNPNRMSAIGFLAYLAGGLLFAVLYAWFFEAVGRATVWLGLAAGALHGVWLLVVFLPILGEIHPRMATARTGPTALKRLEAPGIAGIHYGLNTPLVTLAGQLVYGGLLGFGYDASG